MNDKIYLARLPEYDFIRGPFYGIGFFDEEGNFIFALLKPDFINDQPLRSVNVDCPKKGKEIWDLSILGEIKHLPLSEDGGCKT